MLGGLQFPEFVGYDTSFGIVINVDIACFGKFSQCGFNVCETGFRI
jgi:hypothetical protein